MISFSEAVERLRYIEPSTDSGCDEKDRNAAIEAILADHEEQMRACERGWAEFDKGNIVLYEALQDRDRWKSIAEGRVHSRTIRHGDSSETVTYPPPETDLPMSAWHVTACENLAQLAKNDFPNAAEREPGAHIGLWAVEEIRVLRQASGRGFVALAKHHTNDLGELAKLVKFLLDDFLPGA